MGRADFLQLGDWNVQCYQCGRKRKGSTMKKHWQGYWVCPEHWEPRHPQDFVRNVPDDMTPPWSQPQPAPVFTIPTGTVDNLPLQEQISWATTRTRTLADGITLTEGEDETVNLRIAEGLTLTESTVSDMMTVVADTITLTEQLDILFVTPSQVNGMQLNGASVNAN